MKDEQDQQELQLPSLTDVMQAMFPKPTPKIKEEIVEFSPEEKERMITFDIVFQDSIKALSILHDAIKDTTTTLALSPKITPEVREKIASNHAIVEYYNSYHSMIVDTLKEHSETKDVNKRRHYDNLYRINSLLNSYERMFIIISKLINDESIGGLDDMGIAFRLM